MTKSELELLQVFTKTCELLCKATGMAMVDCIIILAAGLSRKEDK